MVKLTLDGGLLRDAVLLPAVRTLKMWESEGKVEMFESDRAKGSTQSSWPGAPKVQPAPSTRFRSSRRTEAGGLSFQRISLVIFPRRDPHRLNMTEVNAVAHLMKHHALGHSIFVTNDSDSFISEGKRERLKSAFKIVILTPEEAVGSLSESETWTAKASAV